jgi:hypothetical protein
MHLRSGAVGYEQWLNVATATVKYV